MKPKIDQILQQGITLIKEGKLEDAENLYRNILKTEPTNPEANHNLGIVMYMTGRLDKAEESYKKAIEFKADYSQAYSNLGIIFNKSGRLKEAEESYKKAIELNPNYSKAYTNLGNVLMELGRLVESEISYKKSIELKPDYAEAYSNLSMIQNRVGKFNEAESSARKSIELKQDHAEAYNNLGNSLFEIRKLEEAEINFKKAIEFKPDLAEAYCNLGSVLNEIGNSDDAMANYKKAIELKPNFAEAHYNLGIALHSKGKFKEAMEEFKLNDFKLSKGYILTCLFKMDEKNLFYNQLDYLTMYGDNNAMIGSLISRAEVKFKTNRPNLFCKNPLSYVLMTNLIESYDFETIFVKPIKDTLNNNLTLYKKKQSLLTKGNQTVGNIFSNISTALDEVQKIIRLEIEKYFIHFKDSEEGFLKSWPRNYDLNGWLISMKSGGNLSAHMHELGWISGSIYINVPPKLDTNSGNLVVSIEDEQNDLEENKKILDVVTGSLCLFPSSLHHYTIPFESMEDRIVLAFDVIPK